MCAINVLCFLDYWFYKLVEYGFRKGQGKILIFSVGQVWQHRERVGRYNEKDRRMPLFGEAPQPTDKQKSSTDLIDDDDSKSDSSDPVITFGDDLDVPAFIRNRQE